MRANTLWGMIALPGLLALAGTAFGVTLPSGDDTLDSMAISGPVVQTVPNTSTLLVTVTWIRDRTKEMVLTIQEKKTLKFIAEIRRPNDESKPDAATPTGIWVDKCFADSGSVCGGAGIRFAGSLADLQNLIVQRIQERDGQAQASASP
ncbi:MAG: hypothetical protein ACHQZQ_02880 [SAR324 cluster bacterium]